MNDDPPLSLDFTLVSGSADESPADEEGLRALTAFILETEGAVGDWEIAVALVSDDRLQALHDQFMGIDEPTDIMTFPYGDGVSGGDLAISLDHARTRAAEWGNTQAQEIEFLVAHGILHLLGWVDTEPDQRATMLARQEELLAIWRSRAGD